MAMRLCTGNYVAGYALALAGEANRDGRGVAAGGYPITPQSEILEFLRGFRFTKGRVQPVESEHSAMALCMGASLAGARTFTASSSNGLAYMIENIYAAGFCRLPAVMVAVNRTIGPPWNLWVDQGDTLALRDTAWLQFYCESHQEVCDTVLMAFRIAEDRRVLLPAIVAYDGFIISHTSTGVDLPTQEAVDRYLPLCTVPHRLDHRQPYMAGAIVSPEDTARHRVELEEAMAQVPVVLEEARVEFREIFGRTPDGAIASYHTEDAEMVLVACNSIASTARQSVDVLRERGHRVGLIKLKQFRPFPRRELREAIRSGCRIGVLDRNISPGSGGVFWQEVCTTFVGRSDLVIQDYLLGLGGGDVTNDIIERVVADLAQRSSSGEPAWPEHEEPKTLHAAPRTEGSPS
jgi:pyruvate/2-oxoacid:ferredoxin oxidoreductase alpha subunit